MMKIEELLEKINTEPQAVEFAQTIACIEHHYTYHPTAFRNGSLNNAAGENAGSCKIFAFAQLQGLSEQQTLACFGHYFRNEVLDNPDGDNHQNIRQFMRSGWSGIEFEAQPLSANA